MANLLLDITNWLKSAVPPFGTSVQPVNNWDGTYRAVNTKTYFTYTGPVSADSVIEFDYDYAVKDRYAIPITTTQDDVAVTGSPSAMSANGGHFSLGPLTASESSTIKMYIPPGFQTTGFDVTLTPTPAPAPAPAPIPADGKNLLLDYSKWTQDGAVADFSNLSESRGNSVALYYTGAVAPGDTLSFSYTDTTAGSPLKAYINSNGAALDNTTLTAPSGTYTSPSLTDTAYTANGSGTPSLYIYLSQSTYNSATNFQLSITPTPAAAPAPAPAPSPSPAPSPAPTPAPSPAPTPKTPYGHNVFLGLDSWSDLDFSEGQYTIEADSDYKQTIYSGYAKAGDVAAFDYVASNFSGYPGLQVSIKPLGGDFAPPVTTQLGASGHYSTAALSDGDQVSFAFYPPGPDGMYLEITPSADRAPAFAGHNALLNSYNWSGGYWNGTAYAVVATYDSATLDTIFDAPAGSVVSFAYTSQDASGEPSITIKSNGEILDETYLHAAGGYYTSPATTQAGNLSITIEGAGIYGFEVVLTPTPDAVVPPPPPAPVTDPDPTEYNCDCDDDFPTETMAAMVNRLRIRLGLNAVMMPGVTDLLRSFLHDAQIFLFRKYACFRTVRWYSWEMPQGQRFYDFGANTEECLKKMDPRSIQWVGISQGDDQWRPLINHIIPEDYRSNFESIPERYEIRQCIEVWPAPSDDTWTLRIKGKFGLLPFQDDADVTSIDADAVFMYALAFAKAHYQQPDAANYMAQFNEFVGNLVAGEFPTRRYIPRDRQRPNAIPPKMV